MTGTAKDVLLSALAGLFTVKLAARGNGHCDGAAPRIEGEFPNGIHGQLSCGLKVIVIEHDCPGPREKLDPSDEAQVSCSAKFGRPLKSLGPLSKSPLFTDQLKVIPLRVAPEGSLLVRVIVWVVGAEPSNCGGNVRRADDSVIGC